MGKVHDEETAFSDDQMDFLDFCRTDTSHLDQVKELMFCDATALRTRALVILAASWGRRLSTESAENLLERYFKPMTGGSKERLVRALSSDPTKLAKITAIEKQGGAEMHERLHAQARSWVPEITFTDIRDLYQPLGDPDDPRRGT